MRRAPLQLLETMDRELRSLQRRSAVDPEDPRLNVQKAVEKERLGVTLDKLDLNHRAYVSLKGNGINNLPELVARSRAELSTLRHFGKYTLNHIEKSLAKFGLSLRTPS